MKYFYIILLVCLLSLTGEQLVNGMVIPVHSVIDLHDQKPKLEISIYPNPSSSYLSVKNDDDVQHIVIYNIVAKEVQRFNRNHSNKYDIRELQKGIYIVRLYGERNKILKVLRLSKE